MSKQLTYDQTTKLLNNVLKSLVVKRKLRKYNKVYVSDLHTIMKGSQYYYDVKNIGHSRVLELVKRLNAWIEEQSYANCKTNPCNEIYLRPTPSMEAAMTRHKEEMCKKYKPDQPNYAVQSMAVDMARSADRHAQATMIFADYPSLEKRVLAQLNINPNQPSTEKEMSTATKYYVNGQDVSQLSEGNLVDTINGNDKQIEYNKKQIDTYKAQIDTIKAGNLELVEDNRVIKGHIASKRGKTVTKATPAPAPAPNPSV